MTSKRIQRVWEEFQANTASHQLCVAHDSGVYRHWRVGVPGTRLWGWEIATWPGALAIHGDVVQPEIFTGASDMLADFFDVAPTDDDGVPPIDFAYWAEKTGDPAHTRVFSREAFRDAVEDAARQALADGLISKSEADRVAFAASCVENEDDVAVVLRETEPPVAESLSGEDAREFTDSFLRACFAIHKTRQMGGQDR
jgi:hypothetical protein